MKRLTLVVPAMVMTLAGADLVKAEAIKTYTAPPEVEALEADLTGGGDKKVAMFWPADAEEQALLRVPRQPAAGGLPIRQLLPVSRPAWRTPSPIRERGSRRTA